MESVSRIGLFTWTLVLLTLLFFCQTAGAQEPSAANKEAAEAAQAFLALVDQGKYAESWDVCAGPLKEALKKESWYAILAANRSRLGKPESRKLESEETATTVTGGPDGHYDLLRYRTSFETELENKKKVIPVVETMTVLQDEDKQWRVFRYSIRRLTP